MQQCSSNYSNSPQNFPSNFPQNYPPNYQQNPPIFQQNLPFYHPNPSFYQQNYHQNPQVFGNSSQFSPWAPNAGTQTSDFQLQQTCSQYDDSESDRDDNDVGNNNDEGYVEEFIPCTQQFSEDYPVLQPQSQEGGKTVEKKIWSKAEKEALISAYMNTSCDNIVGTQQKKGAFWARFHELYDQARESNPRDIATRSHDSMKSQWTRINEAVQKWCGCFAKAEKRKRSGQSDDDVVKEAHSIFESKGGKFHYYDEWILLRKWPKFASMVSNPSSVAQRGRHLKTTKMVDSTDSGSSGKRTREEGDGLTPNTPTSGDVGDGNMPRPEGVKKAKSRLKEKVKAQDAYEMVGSFKDRLDLLNDVREKNCDMEDKRLQLMMEKEARKKQQLELANRQMEMDLFKVKWDMVQFLSMKENLTPWEQTRLEEAREFVENFKF